MAASGACSSPRGTFPSAGSFRAFAALRQESSPGATGFFKLTKPKRSKGADYVEFQNSRP